MPVSELRGRCRGFWRRRLLGVRDRIDRRVARLERRRREFVELAAARRAAPAESEPPQRRRRPAARPRRKALALES
jgi:hypothetical protein